MPIKPPAAAVFAAACAIAATPAAAQSVATPDTQSSAIDAERAFVGDAHKIGQWAAFRKWATADALMFDPQPVKAQEFASRFKEPETAALWWPGKSFVSCDGTMAVNSGTWVRHWGKIVGYFTTVWEKQPGGTWRWTYDAGDVLDQPRSEGGDIKPVVASCTGKPAGANMLGHGGAVGYSGGGKRSPDGTLVWSWVVGPKGDRIFLAQLWNGSSFDTVIHDKVSAPSQ